MHSDSYKIRALLIEQTLKGLNLKDFDDAINAIDAAFKNKKTFDLSIDTYNRDKNDKTAEEKRKEKIEKQKEKAEA